MNLSGNDKKKITGRKYQPVMSITGSNDQGQKQLVFRANWSLFLKGMLHTYSKQRLSYKEPRRKEL